MTTKLFIINGMKGTFIAIAMFVFVASVQAQGIINANVFGNSSVVDVSVFDPNLGSNVLPDQLNYLNGPSLGDSPDQPITDQSFSVAPSSFSIQAVPEPSPFALSGMAIGLVAVVRAIRKRRLISWN